jgi:hypothetical protein
MNQRRRGEGESSLEYPGAPAMLPVDLNRRWHLEGDGGKGNLVLNFACSSQKLKAWRKTRRILHAGKFFCMKNGEREARAVKGERRKGILRAR